MSNIKRSITSWVFGVILRQNIEYNILNLDKQRGIIEFHLIDGYLPEIASKQSVTFLHNIPLNYIKNFAQKCDALF